MPAQIRYYVNLNGSVMSLTGKLLRPGSEVKIGRDVKDQKAMDDKVTSRYVVSRVVDVAEITDATPGVEKTPTMPHEIDLTAKDGRTEDLSQKKGVRTSAIPGVETLGSRAKDAQKKAEVIGKWAIDPVTLAGKPIEQLNAMILERDPKVTPFEDVNEAIAQLSADFKGK